MWSVALDVFARALSPKIIALVGAGTFVGIVMGALPGLTVTMSVVLLVSVTFGWPTLDALALIIGAYVGGVMGGGQTAILVNIPGTTAAIATTFDGYPLAQRGEAGRAIGVVVTQSFVGGLVGTLALSTIAPLVARFALSFGPHEYFLLGVFGLTLISSLAAGSLVKGLMAAAAGALISTVGMDPLYGVGRFTYGNTYLMGGISYIPALIGLFGMSEVLVQLSEFANVVVKPKVARVLPQFSLVKKLLPLTLKSGIIGVFIGALPGVGGDVAALVSYNEAKRSVRNPTRPFGTGAYEGVAAPETANNAAIGGALIPLLTLGIPGDAVTAVILGAFYIHGLRPGPLVFMHDPGFFWVIVLCQIIANVFMLIFGLSAARLLARVVTIPKYYLMPIVTVLCIIGSYAIEANIFHVFVMFIFGIIGYGMRKLGFHVGPMVLGIILGPIIDSQLRTALVLTKGSILASFVSRPICVVLMAVIVLTVSSQSGQFKRLVSILAARVQRVNKRSA